MIAVIDSGVGGLSILKHLKNQFPGKKMFYFADSVNFPYGSKSKDELTTILSKRISDFMADGAKMVVIACNTATISAISELRKKFAVPIVGIEPAIKPASQSTQNGRVGLIATEGTIKNHDSRTLTENVLIIKQASKNLATKIEESLEDISDDFIKSEFGKLIEAGVDTVVLGCTHYHFIIDRLKGLYPDISFIAPEEPITERVKNLIKEHNINLEEGAITYMASAKHKNLENFIKKIGLENDPIIEFAE